MEGRDLDTRRLRDGGVSATICHWCSGFQTTPFLGARRIPSHKNDIRQWRVVQSAAALQ